MGSRLSSAQAPKLRRIGRHRPGDRMFRCWLDAAQSAALEGRALADGRTVSELVRAALVATYQLPGNVNRPMGRPPRVESAA